jgi:hypothetical protein
MCGTHGSIHPQVIKPSFRAVQKKFAFEYLNMKLIYLRLNVIAQLFSPIIPYIKSVLKDIKRGKLTSYSSIQKQNYLYGDE